MIELVRLAVNILSLLIIAHVILTYVVPPFHPARETLDRFVEPMLAPIRRVLPYTGGFDFSPIILLLLIQLIGRLLIGVLI